MSCWCASRMVPSLFESRGMAQFVGQMHYGDTAGSNQRHISLANKQSDLESGPVPPAWAITRTGGGDGPHESRSLLIVPMEQEEGPAKNFRRLVRACVTLVRPKDRVYSAARCAGTPGGADRAGSAAWLHTLLHGIRFGILNGCRVSGLMCHLLGSWVQRW